MDLTIGDQTWLDQVVEEIVEPDLPMIDPHLHLWRYPGADHKVFVTMQRG